MTPGCMYVLDHHVAALCLPSSACIVHDAALLLYQLQVWTQNSWRECQSALATSVMHIIHDWGHPAPHYIPGKQASLATPYGSPLQATTDFPAPPQLSHHRNASFGFITTHGYVRVMGTSSHSWQWQQWQVVRPPQLSTTSAGWVSYACLRQQLTSFTSLTWTNVFCMQH